MTAHIESQRRFRSSLKANEVPSPSTYASHQVMVLLAPVEHSASDQLAFRGHPLRLHTALRCGRGPRWLWAMRGSHGCRGTCVWCEPNMRLRRWRRLHKDGGKSYTIGVDIARRIQRVLRTLNECGKKGQAIHADCGIGFSDGGQITTNGDNTLIRLWPALLVRETASAPHEFDHLVRRPKVQLPGQGSLLVLLQELASPVVPEFEVQINPTAIILGHGVSVGETINITASWRRKVLHSAH